MKGLDKCSEVKEKSSQNTHSLVCKIISPSLRKKDSTVLDAPCGSGALTKNLQEAGFHVTVHGIDVMDSCPNPDVRYRKSDLNSRIPFDDATFDVIACVDGVAHIQNPFYLIKEFRRILKKDGFLILSSPNLSSLRSRWRFFLTGFHNKRKIPLDSEQINPQHIINALDCPDLIYILESGGFEVEDIRINRVKLAGILYSVFIPFCWLVSAFALFLEIKKEKRWSSRSVRRTIVRMFNPQVLLGETLIIKAR